jgi:hypothetical protein
MAHNCNQANCKHEAVKFCSHCGKVYCETCGREWEDKCTLNHYSTGSYIYPTNPQIYPYYTTTTAINSAPDSAGQYCTHTILGN